MSFDKRVNSFLAGSISVINAVVAIGYPALTALMSGILMANLGPGGFSFVAFLGGAVIGGLGGVLFAGIVCGVLAVLIDIRNSLSAKENTSQ